MAIFKGSFLFSRADFAFSGRIIARSPVYFFSEVTHPGIGYSTSPTQKLSIEPITNDYTIHRILFLMKSKNGQIWRRIQNCLKFGHCEMSEAFTYPSMNQNAKSLPKVCTFLHHDCTKIAANFYPYQWHISPLTVRAEYPTIPYSPLPPPLPHVVAIKVWARRILSWHSKIIWNIKQCISVTSVTQMWSVECQPLAGFYVVKTAKIIST